MGVKMKRRYKLLLIILIGMVATIIINSCRLVPKTTVTALGDSLSLGMTPYNVAGTSFNDYLKERLENAKKLDVFNNEFSLNHLRIHELNDYLSDNVIGKYTRVPIKQTLAKSELITLAIGIDEFASNSIAEDITSEVIDNYISEINKFLKSLREFYDEKIVVIGLYPAYNFNKKDAVEVNSKLQILCGKYNASFLDILAISLKPEYYLEQNSYYLNYKAHHEISKMLYVMYKNN